MIALNVADPWRPIIQTTDYVCEFYGEIEHETLLMRLQCMQWVSLNMFSNVLTSKISPFNG